MKTKIAYILICIFSIPTILYGQKNIKQTKPVNKMIKTGKEYLKKDFISILDWYKKNNLLHPIFENDLNRSIDFYHSIYDESYIYLKKVAEQYTFANRANLKLYKEELVPYSKVDEQFIVSLDTEIGEKTIAIFLNQGGSSTLIDKDLGVLKLESFKNKQNSSKTTFADTSIFPIKHFRRYETIKSEIENAFYFTFLSYIWQEVDGNKNGSITSTNENNSGNQFFMNDFSHGDFSKFSQVQWSSSNPSHINEYFNRKLTTEELFIRAKFVTYPLNPYVNNYRYFEKNDEFVELILYTDFVGIRADKKSNYKNAKVNSIKTFKTLEESCLYLKTFSDEKINSNWSEKLRPDNINIKFVENHLEFDYFSGLRWYPSDVEKRISYENINSLEQKFNIVLPISFKTYLRLLNGHKKNNSMPFYSFENQIISVENFLNFDDLNNELSTLNKEYLKIGNIKEGYLTLTINKLNINYGKVGIEKNGIHIVTNQSFEEFIRHSYSTKITYPFYYIIENNINKLKLYLSEKDKTNKELIDQAIESNSYETLDYLLKEGFEFRHKDSAEHFSKIYDIEIVKILNSYFK